MDNISPIDSRYRNTCIDLRTYVSESAFINYKVYVEISYLRFMISVLFNDTDDQSNLIQEIDFFDEAPKRVKEIESEINHDVKAVELYVKEKLRKENIDESIISLVHFGLTSEDITGIAYKLMLADVKHLITKFSKEASEASYHLTSNETIMLAKTHGQFAYPTKFSNEMNVFVSKLIYEGVVLDGIDLTGKFGGAVGNLIDHKLALPHIDWEEKMDDFISCTFGLVRQENTTQIENFTDFCEVLDSFKRIALVIQDFCKDMWLYVSHDYLKLKPIESEVGSSVMAHKINPIHFENAIGNTRMAVNMLELLVRELPISSLQRDLTTSTMIRNIGSAFGYLVVAIKSCISGIRRVEVNAEKINKDIQENWQVFSGIYQNFLKIHTNVSNPYEVFKEFVRDGKPKTKKEMHDFIDSILDIPNEVKEKMKNIDIQTISELI